VENLGIEKLFDNIYKDKTVLLTGHTGFKGSWLALVLTQLGAEVVGYALPPFSYPNHFEILKLPIKHIEGDINDTSSIRQVIRAYQPDIIFHLAAQSLVRKSYREPLLTYQTNVLGTLNVYEAVRQESAVKAIVSVTSDKVYKNEEWLWAYRENDVLGGYDMYSSSKACAEILTSSFRDSFFNINDYGKQHQTLIATVRAGNVIGGGDWAEDRLIPDIIRAATTNQVAIIRNPHAVRPWQHVLDPIFGYLLLGQKLLEGNKDLATAWNFGPQESDSLSVEEVSRKATRYWDKIQISMKGDANLQLHEAIFLKVDTSRARKLLSWQPIWNVERTLEKTIDWYREYYENNKVLSLQDLNTYIEDAIVKKAIWTR